MSTEQFTPPEIPKQGNDTTDKPQKPFDPIKQRLSWSIDLVNKEYHEKTWKDLSDETKQLLIQAIKWKSQDERDEILDDVSYKIQKWWNIEEDLKSYLWEFAWKEIDLQTNETERKISEDLNIRWKQFKEFSNSLASLNVNKPEYTSILKRFNDLKNLVAENKWFTQEFDNKLTAILSDLKNSPKTLQAIALDLQAKDPKSYEAFRLSLISLDPSFKNILSAADAKAKLALWSDSLKGAAINGNISQTSPDGYTTTAKLDGTGRTLRRADSNYTLRSTLRHDEQAQREADRLTGEVNKELEPINNTLQSLQAVKSYLETALNSDADINEVKEVIKKFSLDIFISLWLDHVNSIVELNSRVDNHIATLSTKRDEIEKEFQEALNKLTSFHSQELADKQKYQKQILDMLHDTWIDGLGQNSLDLILKNINLNYAKYWFATPIDFENGLIWFDTDVWNKNINPLEKQKFYEACNRLITWNPSYPIWYKNWNLVYYTTSQDAQNSIPATQLFDIHRFVKTSLWLSPEITGKRNLDSSISQYWLIGSNTNQ